MTGMARRVHAARGHLARLVAVLAVLAGLAVVVGLQCTDGMAMAMAHGATSATAAMTCGAPAAMAASPAPERLVPADDSRLTAACAAPSTAAAFAFAKDESSGSGGLGGMLATCLAFLVAVVGAVAALRPAGMRSVMMTLRSARVVVIRAIRPRTPSLAELCLLRT